MRNTRVMTIEIEKIELEKKMIEKSIRILSKKKISRTEEKIVADTVRLIEFTHSLNYQNRPVE